MMKPFLLIRLFACFMFLASCLSLSACGQDWEATLQGYIDDSLTLALKSAPATEIQKIFCRKADLDKKIFSVRSFDGRLCESKHIKVLDLVGGAALFLCWDSNLEDFQSSGCATQALAQWKLTKATYSRDKLFAAMKPVVLEYAKAAEKAAGSAVPFYSQAKFMFCLFDASLYGPGAELHNLLCKN